MIVPDKNLRPASLVISAGTIHDLRRVKVPGTGPLCVAITETKGSLDELVTFNYI
jgi:hypothetical protein